MTSVFTRIARSLRSYRVPTPGIDNHYFRLATQYYAAARGGVFAGCGTVAGNLFHHAVELYLKGDLSTGLSRVQLTKYGHNLRKLWSAYKRKHSSSPLSSFDATINALHKFEAIRYPNAIAAKGMFYGLPITRPDPPLAFKVTSGSTPPTYLLVVNEVDELIRGLLVASSVNPGFYFSQLGSEGRAIIYRDNPAFDPGPLTTA